LKNQRKKRRVNTPTVFPQLRPYQRAVLRAVMRSVRERAGRTFSVMIARQGGKNELSAQLELTLLWAHLRRDVDAVKCAPTFMPQARLSMRRLWSRLHGAGLGPLAASEAGYIIRLGNARQVFLSAEPGANVAGHTCHTLLEVDEAQDVEVDTFDKNFRPMAATTNATTVYYGTAWTETDLLAQVRERHLELERRDGIRRHFAFDWQEVARFNPAYARFVAAERERLGEDHPLFQTQYCLRPLAGGGRLFTPAQLALLEGAHDRAHGPTRAPALLGYVAGLDVGGETFGNAERGVQIAESRGGPDRTVLTIARVIAPSSEPDSALRTPHSAIEVVEHSSWQGAPHAELAGTLARLLRDVWRVRRLVVDATGLGEGLAGSLAALRPGLPGEVVRLRLTEALKSRLGYGLLAAVNGGRLTLYRSDGSLDARTVREECARARASYRPNRTLRFAVDPADGHDDYLLSLALAVEAATGLVPRSARGRIPEDGP
jgi:hypothetical protein